MWFKLWTWFHLLREDLVILFFAWRNPATPRYIKTMLLFAIGYLISPVDFIPDYLPLMGLVDDVTIVPAALLYITRLLPPGVRQECEQHTERVKTRMPYILTAIAVLLAAWVVFLIWGIYALITK